MQQPEITILAVDDDDAVLFLVERILSRQGYAVETTISPTAALQLMKTKKYDLIISDIEMPEMSGIEMIKSAKSLLKITTPVLVLSSKNTSDVILKAKDAGVSYYLMKPFSTTDLILKVNSILERNKK